MTFKFESFEGWLDPKVDLVSQSCFKVLPNLQLHLTNGFDFQSCTFGICKIRMSNIKIKEFQIILQTDFQHYLHYLVC